MTRLRLRYSSCALAAIIALAFGVGASISIGQTGGPERKASRAPASETTEATPATAKPSESKPPETKPVEPPKSPEKPKGAGTKSSGDKSDPTKAKPHSGPPTLEARLTAGGSLPVSLLDERIDFLTPYGKLSVPLADVLQIELATRIPSDVADQVEKAIRDLGADELAVRDRASAELLAIKERAYAALVKAVDNSDPEVARRAEALIEKLRELVSEERLATRVSDVIHTRDSKFTGTLVGDSLRIKTAQFGEQRLKFSDVYLLRHASMTEETTTSKDVQADPGNLSSFQAMIGKTFTFRVRGETSGSLWGTGMYTLDSKLAVAAVHAGAIKAGETGNVRVQILPPQAAFVGSTQNGITSSAYDTYPGAYRIIVPRK